MEGDNTAKLLSLNVDSATDANLQPGNMPALRIGPPASQHLRIDGNELISIASDNGTTTTQGPFFLNPLAPVNISGMVKTGTRNSGAITADLDKDITITYDQPFPESGPVPRIYLQTQVGSLANAPSVSKSNVTRTGFTLTVRRSTTTTFDTDWLAIATTAG